MDHIKMVHPHVGFYFEHLFYDIKRLNLYFITLNRNAKNQNHSAVLIRNSKHYINYTIW
jgi:hypothetical protein